MKSAATALSSLLVVTLAMGCHKTPPPPAPVQWEYNSFKIYELNDKPYCDLEIYDYHDHKTLLSSNVTDADQVLNAIAPYGWELVTINDGEYNVKRPRGSFTNVSFVVALLPLPDPDQKK